ncbi:TetR/AcrR family transcriptional regulator [Nocardia sp. NPDC004123]
MKPALLEPARSPSPADYRAARLLRREQALTAALTLFSEHDYHAVAMTDIAQRAGMSKPILYKHFTNKLDLYLAVLQSRLDAFVPAVRRAAGTPGDRRTRLRAIIQSYFDFADIDTLGYQLVFGSSIPAEPSAQLRLSKATGRCIDAVSHVISPEPSIDDHRLRTISSALVGMIHFTVTAWINANRPITKTDAIDTTADLYWGGLSGIPHRTTTT